MAQVYLGLGSNIENPQAQLNTLLDELTHHPDIDLVTCSSFYRTMPMGPQDQPPFINAVCEVNTDLSPLDLLAAIKTLEAEHSRIKTRHWGPRTLDIDILLYDDVQLKHPELTIPHPGMMNRDFVLIPLIEIAPQLHAWQNRIDDCERYTINKIPRVS